MISSAAASNDSQPEQLDQVQQQDQAQAQQPDQPQQQDEAQQPEQTNPPQQPVLNYETFFDGHLTWKNVPYPNPSNRPLCIVVLMLDSDLSVLNIQFCRLIRLSLCTQNCCSISCSGLERSFALQKGSESVGTKFCWFIYWSNKFVVAAPKRSQPFSSVTLENDWPVRLPKREAISDFAAMSSMP